MPGTSTPPGALERPRLWRLAIQLDGEVLHAAVWSTVEESSLLQFALPLDPTLPRLKALEEAVYAAPVLLSDFGSVDILIRTRAYTIIPSGSGENTADATAAYMRLDSDDAPQCVRTDTPAETGLSIVWTMPAETSNFLARTFRNPRMHCHMYPLMSYFGRSGNQANRGKVYVHLHSGTDGRSADIIAINPEGTVTLAATHGVTSDSDALYYTLAAARQAGLDLRHDDILLCGNQPARDALMPKLRQYAATVMPVIFPSAAFRNGREALNAPFPLAILPLCE